MPLNDIAQWVAIGALALLTIAMYRQLGLILMGDREVIELAFGPDIGSPAGSRLHEVIGGESGNASSRVAVFVKQGCQLCDEVLQAYEQRGELIGPIVAIVVDGEGSFIDSVRRRFPETIVDAWDRLFKSDERPRGYPFGIEVAPDGIVAGKEIGTRVLELILPEEKSEDDENQSAEADGFERPLEDDHYRAT